MSELNGCGGRICRALRWRANKVECFRYAEDGFGGIDESNVELSYKLCGKICGKIGKASSGSVDIPGRSSMSYASVHELLVIASSETIEVGDVVCDGDYRYRITERISNSPEKYALDKIYDDFEGNEGA